MILRLAEGLDYSGIIADIEDKPLTNGNYSAPDTPNMERNGETVNGIPSGDKKEKNANKEEKIKIKKENKKERVLM